MAIVESSMLQAMEWRSIGPFRGGRVVAVAGDPEDIATFYFGCSGGGVWKTDNGGVYWKNVSDRYFKTGSVGAIAVSEADPNVIYVGMGESCIRGNVSHGDGVYKSTDGGKTWVHLGLEDTRHIARVRIHPQDPDLVYVAALGHAFGPNEERGIFRSQDGGQTWENVLFKSEKAGAADLSIDLTNPRIMYAAIWEAQRLPYDVKSGGPDSGLWKTRDGGDTWQDISGSPGLPPGPIGRIGVAASPARSGRVWALIEAEEGGMYRSDNGGESWEKMSSQPELLSRPFYYTHAFAHPTDPDTCYVLSNRNWKSTDGGRTFQRFHTPHDDNHDMWIDPKNPNRIVHGNDEGASVSYNGGEDWTRLDNQPTSQFYHVTTDTNFPYRVYGAAQDCSTISIPIRSHSGAITSTDWYAVGGGESGYIAVRSDDPNIVYAGHHVNGRVTRYDHRTGQARDIKVWPEAAAGWGAKDVEYRFQWTFPIVLSPHDPGVLYVTGNHVFRTTDEGSSWEVLSPDLTRNDESKMNAPGGPITKESTNVEYYGTIFAFTESPIEPGQLWAGSDDGLLHVSRDNGKTWTNVTPKDLPEWSLISIIEASPHDPAVAYVAATRYKLDDTNPYLFKTIDYGKSWQRITSGIPDHDFTRVIREDPARRGLLYAGTETGVYVSFDDGVNWQPLQQNMPHVPVHDFVIKDSDLVVATHGRSFWVLDDLSPLHQITDDVAQSHVHLFAPRPTYRFPARRGGLGGSVGRNNDRGDGAIIFSWDQTIGENGQPVRNFLDAGPNPPDGVWVSYYLKEKQEDEVTLTFSDQHGTVIRSFTSVKEKAGTDGLSVPTNVGLNRFLWDMRYPDAQKYAESVGAEGYFSTLRGPVAPPGTYQVQISASEQQQAQSFEIRKSPLISATHDDLEAEYQLLLMVRDKLSESQEIVRKINDIRNQMDPWVVRAEKQTGTTEVSQAADHIRDQLKFIEEVVARTGPGQPMKLGDKLAGLSVVIASADERPTKQCYDVLQKLSTHLTQLQAQLEGLIKKEVGEFNLMVAKMEIPALVPISNDQ
jgi:photosystem II stability/assembly factor-like uncharacterized protein